jgi:hypothetical protein
VYGQSNNTSTADKIDYALENKIDFFLEISTGGFGNLKYCYLLDSVVKSNRESIRGKLIKKECTPKDSTEYLSITVKKYSIIEGNRVEISFREMKNVDLSLNPVEDFTDTTIATNYSFTHSNSCDYIRLTNGEIINVQIQEFYENYLTYKWCCGGCAIVHSINIKSIDSLALSDRSSQNKTEGMNKILDQLEEKPKSSVVSNEDSTFMNHEKVKLKEEQEMYRKRGKNLSISGACSIPVVLSIWAFTKFDTEFWVFNVFGAKATDGIGYPILAAGIGLAIGGHVARSKANKIGRELYNMNKRY